MTDYRNFEHVSAACGQPPCDRPDCAARAAFLREVLECLRVTNDAAKRWYWAIHGVGPGPSCPFGVTPVSPADRLLADPRAK